MTAYRTLLSVCTAALLLAGCAGEEAMRETAARSASMLNSYGNSVDTFLKAQNETLAAVHDRVKDLEKDQKFLAGKVEVRRDAWVTTNNTAALRLYDNLADEDVQEVLAQSPELQSLRPAAPPPKVEVDTKPYATVVKSLTALSKEPSFHDRVSFLIDFGRAVAAEHKAMTEKATEKAKDDAAKATNPETKPNSKAGETPKK